MKRQALIIDDSDDDREFYERMLTHESPLDWEILCAEDGEQGLGLLTERVELVLLDYSLPGLSGLEVLAEIRRYYPATAVIMLTGQGSESIATEAMRRGAHDYVVKSDLDGETFAKAVRNSLERAMMEERIRHQQDALESFARVLSHDMRAPVRQLMTFGEFMKETLHEQRYDELEGDIDRVITCADRLRRLVDAVSSYSGVTGELEFDAVSLDAAFEGACHKLGDVISETHARVRSEPLPEVNGNGPLLVQLLQNLIGNSLTYCRDDAPQVTVSSEQSHDGYWTISVRDNGIGVPDDSLEIIFEPLKRLHARSEFEGTGLGLATCRKIVERHRGRIWCESVPGEGTTVRFTLPLSPR